MTDPFAKFMSGMQQYAYSTNDLSHMSNMCKYVFVRIMEMTGDRTFLDNQESDKHNENSTTFKIKKRTEECEEDIRKKIADIGLQDISYLEVESWDRLPENGNYDSWTRGFVPNAHRYIIHPSEHIVSCTEENAPMLETVLTLLNFEEQLDLYIVKLLNRLQEKDMIQGKIVVVDGEGYSIQDYLMEFERDALEEMCNFLKCI